MSNLSEEEKVALQRLRGQTAMMAVQEMLTQMSNLCNKKCITKPGTSLSTTEQRCLSMCMDRFTDTMNIVTNTVAKRGAGDL